MFHFKTTQSSSDQTWKAFRGSLKYLENEAAKSSRKQHKLQAFVKRFPHLSFLQKSSNTFSGFVHRLLRPPPKILVPQSWNLCVKHNSREDRRDKTTGPLK